MAAFWFHYNKPASARRGHPVMTIHYQGVCMLVRKIVCGVPVRTRERNSQPRIVLVGRGIVRLSGDTAIIEKGA